MLAQAQLSTATLLAALRAAGEATRLRILALLVRGELTVKDLTAILGQSQPRMSRHLKLLAEAGLVERHPEGAWVYYRLAEGAGERRLVQALVETLDPHDPLLGHDVERLALVKREHAEAAERYFADHAVEWDAIRSLHVDEHEVEAAMKKAIGERPFDAMLDLGTGSGRLLEIFAPLYEHAVGVDFSTAMLAVARHNLDRAGIRHAQVRYGDIYHLGLRRDSFNLVTIHQVLHYLDDPARAVAEAARVLRPGGRLLVVDFAPHALEFLRERDAHRRLGLAHDTVRQWIEAAGLSVDTILDLVPDRETEAKLTVTLWLAHDPRMLLAGELSAELAGGRA
jgi:ArsR family transcriptional regulator